MGQNEDANEQLRKSCDYCARMKRACDGQVPCALCCRRGKTCARSVRRKSGPAKGAKYAPRRSKVEKESAAAATEVSRGPSVVKAKNRNQGTKQRGFGDTGGKELGDENGKTASRRLRQAKSQVHDDNVGDRVPPFPSGSTPQPSSPPARSASATASAEAKKHGHARASGDAKDGDDGDLPCEAKEARAGSPPRNDAEGRDASPRRKDSQPSMKKRKSVAIKEAVPSQSDTAQPRKKRGFSDEDGSLAAAKETGCDKRTWSNRPEHKDASPLSSSSASTERPRAFPRDKCVDERPREARTGCHERLSSAAVATDEGDQSRRKQQQQQPWQGELSAEAPPLSADAPSERERCAVVVARENERKPLGASGIAPAQEAAPSKEGGDGLRGVGRVPVTVSPTREDEGPPELPPRVRALEPSIQRGGIDAYYRKHAGLGVQSSRGMMGQPQSEQTLPLAPKELLLMLRPNDKDIIDVIVDDKRGAARREGLGAPFRGQAARAVGSVSVPRTSVSSNRSNGSDSHARTQARELLARIRRDAAAAHSKAASHEEFAPKTIAVVSPAAISITAGECGSGVAPAPRDRAGGAAHEFRGPNGNVAASLGRSQGWGASDEFGRTSLPRFQHGRGAYEAGYGCAREHVGVEYPMGRLERGVGHGGSPSGGAGYADCLRAVAGPVLGPRDLIEGCLGPEKTDRGSRGGEGGHWRAPPVASSLSAPGDRIPVDYQGARPRHVHFPSRDDERKAAMSRAGHDGSWVYSLPPHAEQREWRTVPMSVQPQVVNHGHLRPSELHHPSYSQGRFYPAGDYRLSGPVPGGVNAGIWKGNTWSLGTLSERRAVDDYRHGPHQEHPGYNKVYAGNSSGPAEDASNHRSRAQRDGWPRENPARVSPNVGSDTC